MPKKIAFTGYVRERKKASTMAHAGKTQKQIQELMHSKGLMLRRKTSNWFWMYKSVIDNYARQIGAIGLAVYCVLSRFCDEETTIVSYTTISKLLNITRKTVIKYVLLLESLGLMIRDKRKFKSGEYGSNVYYLAGGRIKKGGNDGYSHKNKE